MPLRHFKRRVGSRISEPLFWAEECGNHQHVKSRSNMDMLHKVSRRRGRGGGGGQSDRVDDITPTNE
jgi:hypothetical protein